MHARPAHVTLTAMVATFALGFWAPAVNAAGTARDRAPVLSHVRMTHHRFRVGRRSTAEFASKHVSAPVGTTLS